MRTPQIPPGDEGNYCSTAVMIKTIVEEKGDITIYPPLKDISGSKWKVLVGGQTVGEGNILFCAVCHAYEKLEIEKTLPPIGE